jgi:predicted RNase H-like HicB family nuclease
MTTLEYHAAFYRTEDSNWIVVEVLDFPGALSQGRTLNSARRMIRDALRLMAEVRIEEGEPLPQPNPKVRDKEAFLIEPVQLKIRVQTGRVA